MTQSTAQTFACPKCAKRFTWKQEFAGRNIACSCGRVFKAMLSFENAGLERELYDVGTDPVPAAASVPPVKKNIIGAYPQRKSAAAAGSKVDLDAEAGQPLKHIYFPWAVLLLGMAIRIAQILYGSQTSLHGAIFLTVLDVHLNAAVMLGGAYLAALFLGADFGTLPRASIKLGGIAIFADGVAAWAIVLGHRSMPALLLGLHLELLLYFVLFYAMFELDVQESLVTVVIVWVLQCIVQVALFSLMSA
jgi:hypothetical protein